MADTVYIDGFSPDALASLPEWASESTLNNILKTLQSNTKMQESHFIKLENALKKFAGVKSSDNTKDSTSTTDPKLMGQVNDELRDSLKFGAEEANQNKKKKKQWAESNKQHTVGEALFGKLSKSAILFNGILAGIDVVAAKGILAISANVNAYSELYKSGIGLVDSTNTVSSGLVNSTSDMSASLGNSTKDITDGFQSLQHLVLLSGIRLGDLNAVMTKYSTTVSVYGTQKFTKALVSSQLELKKFGYSATEGLEFTAQYLDAIKGFTNTANLSTEEVGKSAGKFGESMRNVSLLTGQSTTELMTKFKDLAKSTDAFILTSQVGEGASKNLLAFTASLKDQGLAKQILATVTAPIKEIDSTVNALLSSGQGRIAQQYKDVANRIKSASEHGASTEQLAEIYRQFGANMHASAADIQNLQLQGTEQSKAALSIIMSAQQAAKDTIPLTKQSLDAIKKDTDAQNARSRIATQWNAIIAKFVAIFTPSTKLLTLFGDALEYVNDKMTEVGAYFEGSIIPSVIAIGVALTSAVASILFGTSTLKKLWGTFTGVKPPIPEVAKPGMFSKIGDVLKSGVSKIWAWISDIFSSIAVKLGSVFKSIMTSLEGAFLNTVKWISSIGSRLWTVISSPFEAIGSRIWGLISNVFKSASTGIIETLGSWVSKIFGVFEPVIGIISKLGGLFLRFAGIVGILYSAFEVGYSIGTWLNGLVSDFAWFQKGMDTLFTWLDHLLQYLPGQIGKDAKERIDTKEKLEKQEKDEKDNTNKTTKVTIVDKKLPTPEKPQIVVPPVEVKLPTDIKEPKAPADRQIEPPIEKEPTPIIEPIVEKLNFSKTKVSGLGDEKLHQLTEPSRTSVQSVSASNPMPLKDETVPKLSTASDNESIAKTPPTAKEPEINSILKYQTSLLEQLLDKESDILSTNRELLKITRNS